MTDRFNDWLDQPDRSADSFIKSAVGELPRVETKVVGLNKDAWPAEVWEEIEREMEKRDE